MTETIQSEINNDNQGEKQTTTKQIVILSMLA